MILRGFVSVVLFTSFGVILIFAQTGFSLPISKDSSTKKSTLVVRASTISDCGITGNTDFYGLGIRVGIYLQWITSLLANRYLHEEIRPNLETNTIFLLAVFIATAIASGQHETKPPEVVVLLYLCFGFVFSILSIWGHRTRSTPGDIVRFSYSGSLFRLTLITAICVYASWFWFAGINAQDDIQCTRFTFIFTKIDVRDGIRYFYQALTLIAVIIYGILWLRELVVAVVFLSATIFYSGFKAAAVAYFCAKNVNSHAGEPEFPIPPLKVVIKKWLLIVFTSFWSLINSDESGEDRPAVDFWIILFLNFFILVVRTRCQFLMLAAFKRCTPIGFPPMLSYSAFDSVNGSRLELIFKWIRRLFQSENLQSALFAINVLVVAWTIASVEIILLWNNITGIYVLSSTGQLIPFIIAVVSFLRVLHGIIVRYCDILNTDILLQMLDNEVDLTEKCSKLNQGYPNEKICPLRDGSAAVFEIRSPGRRHSFCASDLATLKIQDDMDTIEQSHNDSKVSNTSSRDSTTTGFKIRSIERRHSFCTSDPSNPRLQDQLASAIQSSRSPELRRQSSLKDLDNVQGQLSNRRRENQVSEERLNHNSHQDFVRPRMKSSLLSYCFQLSVRLTRRLLRTGPLPKRLEFAYSEVWHRILNHASGIEKRSLKRLGQRNDILDDNRKLALNRFHIQRFTQTQPGTDGEALLEKLASIKILAEKLMEELHLRRRWTAYLYTFRSDLIPALLEPSLYDFLQALIKLACQLLQTLYPLIDQSFIHSASKLQDTASVVYEFKQIRRWKQGDEERVTLEMQHLLTMNARAVVMLRDCIKVFLKDFEEWVHWCRKTNAHDSSYGPERHERPPETKSGEEGVLASNHATSSTSPTNQNQGQILQRPNPAILAGLAAVATSHAVHGVYSSMEATKERRKLVLSGEMTIEEARKRHAKNLTQDAAAIGIAILTFKSAYSEWTWIAKSHKEGHELEAYRIRLEESHERYEMEAEKLQEIHGNSNPYRAYIITPDSLDSSSLIPSGDSRIQ